MEALKRTGFLLLWGFLLFSQHVVCFDMFDTNAVYLHLLALALAVARDALLWANRKRRTILRACGLAYGIVSVLELPIALALLFPSGWQTHMTCLLLDIAGAVLCVLLAEIRRKR